MFLELLLVAAILTAVVTWVLNRRQVAEAVEDTNQVTDSDQTAGKKSRFLATTWFRRGQTPTDEAQEPTGDTKQVADTGETAGKKSRLSASSWFRRGQKPKDEAQEPTGQAQTATDDAQTPTMQAQAPTDEASTQQAQAPTDDLSIPSEAFQAWVASTDKIDPELQAWFSTLSDEALNKLTKQLAIHCQNLGMELDWLFGKQLHLSPSLQETMPQLIIAYLTSRHKAAQVQDEAQALKTYQEFDKNPQNHREFARKLLANLVEHGLVTISASDLLHDDTQKRQDYIVKTIRQAANDEPVAFNQALKAVMKGA